MSKLVLKQFDIWTADLDPSTGSERDKIRPVVILQSNALNQAGHSSTIACSISSQPKEGFSLIRITVDATLDNGLKKQSFILADQICALDLTRLKERIGRLDDENSLILKESIRAILDIY